MKYPIVDKDKVLDVLESRLHICEVVINHSISNNEPPECQAGGRSHAASLREAIRFIEGHSIDVVDNG